MAILRPIPRPRPPTHTANKAPCAPPRPQPLRYPAGGLQPGAQVHRRRRAIRADRGATSLKTIQTGALASPARLACSDGRDCRHPSTERQ
eukprot:2115797-Prymnesium_polylepis.1